MNDRDIYNILLNELTPGELHDRGIVLLGQSLDRQDARDQLALAAQAQAFFFAAVSADTLKSSGGAHRTDENTPPAGAPEASETAARIDEFLDDPSSGIRRSRPGREPNEFTGHHG